MVTVKEAYLAAKKALTFGGIENAAWEADILFENVMGKRRFVLQPDDPLPERQAEVLLAQAEKRAGHYPLQYLCGSWPFMEIELTVGEGVLIPRGDTACVVEKALSLIETAQQPRVLDLCSGSGTIAAAVKYYRPEAEVTAVELSEKAMRYLRLNCGHTVTAVQADVFAYQNALPEGELHL
ncbi:MAG: methyltransferase, partial [Oscillospiraceae bacterium]|nr:methyltransferase [Oscillospiraceae bacterium]